MKTIVIFFKIACLLLIFTSCEKDYNYEFWQQENQQEQEALNPQSSVFYSFRASDAQTKSSSTASPIGDNDVINLVKGNAIFYTFPADTTCVWIINSVVIQRKDQIEKSFSEYGTYNITVIGKNTPALSFVVEVSERGGDNDNNNQTLINYNLELISRTDRGSYWELIFWAKNQYPSHPISSYGHVGIGYMNSSWTINRSMISFHESTRDVLVYEMRIAKDYIGQIKFCLAINNTLWFNPNLNNLGGVFWNQTTPTDKVWQFVFNGSSGNLYSHDGLTLINPSSQTRLVIPGKLGGDGIRYTVNNEPGQDKSLRMYIKTDSNVLRYASSSNFDLSSTTTMKSLNLVPATNYPGWRTATIPREDIFTYLWFHFGTISSGVYTRNSSLDNSHSNLFLSSFNAFMLIIN